MRLYCGIDLHSSNAYVVVLDELDRVIYRCRLPTDLSQILAELEVHREQLVGIAVESTFNWYWLVDGLMEAGYWVHLANPAAMQQYSGLKFTDDQSDARWLAHLLRLGLLRVGYIYPREQRGLRDLLRKRARLVQQRTANLLSVQGILQRNTGRRPSIRALSLDLDKWVSSLPDTNVRLAVESTCRVLVCLNDEIRQLERAALKQIRPTAQFKLLKSIAGVGNILGSAIALETGEIGRFRAAGNYVSYCRSVGSRQLTNAKSKGQGNTKNGNRYLAWAWMEAANFAIRYQPRVRRFYERKQSRTHRVVALKAVAHKLARAGYYVMRDGTPFRVELAFG